jgi:hypothetical protein
MTNQTHATASSRDALPTCPVAELTDDQLIDTIKAHVEKGDKARNKAEQHYASAGLYLKALREASPSKAAWETVVKSKCGLGATRAYDFIAIAEGRKTISDIRLSANERKKRHRAACPFRNGQNLSAEPEPNPPSPEQIARPRGDSTPVTEANACSKSALLNLSNAALRSMTANELQEHINACVRHSANHQDFKVQDWNRIDTMKGMLAEKTKAEAALLAPQRSQQPSKVETPAKPVIAPKSPEPAAEESSETYHPTKFEQQVGWFVHHLIKSDPEAARELHSILSTDPYVGAGFLLQDLEAAMGNGVEPAPTAITISGTRCPTATLVGNGAGPNPALQAALS